MPQKYYITPAGNGGSDGGDVDNSLPEDQPGIDNSLPIGPPGGIAKPPIVIPMPPEIGGGPIILPPVVLPPTFPDVPIVIPVPPDKPNPMPPGTIWPPVGPDDGIPEGENWILAILVGAKGKKKFKLIKTDVHIEAPIQPTPEPK